MTDTSPIACLDAAYSDEAAGVACAICDHWQAETASRIVTRSLALSAQAYEPGAFYKRELPLLIEILSQFTEPIGAIVIDGYVWLGEGKTMPGLGARLFQELGANVAVIGVAKNPFKGDDWSVPVLRGMSERPLFVTAAGIDVAEAARRICSMHGEHRIPTILGMADRAAKDAVRNAVEL